MRVIISLTFVGIIIVAGLKSNRHNYNTVRVLYHRDNKRRSYSDLWLYLHVIKWIVMYDTRWIYPKARGCNEWARGLLIQHILTQSLETYEVTQ